MEKPQTKRQRRKDARPEEILKAAVLEFDRNGFGQSTLAGIARRAGISRTTIYLYYETKEAIFEAAMRKCIESPLDDIAQMAAAPHGDFRSMFTKALDVIYERLVCGDASVFFRILIAEGQTMPALVALYRREILAKGENAIAAMIEYGIASGEVPQSFRQCDLRVYIAPAIVAALWGQVFAQVDPLDLDIYKSTHIDMVTGALTQTPI